MEIKNIIFILSIIAIVHMNKGGLSRKQKI